MSAEEVDLSVGDVPQPVQAGMPAEPTAAREGEVEVQVPDDVVTDAPTDVLAEVSMLVPEDGAEHSTEEGDTAHVGGVDPTPEFDGTVTLSTGHVLNVRPVKTRQFLRLIKIIMQGAPNVLPLLVPDQDDFKTMLRVALLNAMGDAPDAVIEFIQGAVQIRPEDFANKSQNEQQNLIREINSALIDPEMEDTVEIINGVIQLEGDHLEALGKRVVEMAKKPVPR